MTQQSSGPAPDKAVPPPPPAAAKPAVSPKSRTAAAVLSFLLGTLGAHRFYVGKYSSAIVMLVLTIVGSIFGYFYVLGWILTSAVGIWSLIDFIMILLGRFRDKEGLALSRW